MSRLGTLVKEINRQRKDFVYLYRRKGLNAFLSYKDYMRLRRDKMLTIDEFINYEVALRDREFSDSFLSLQESFLYLRVLNPGRYAVLARDKYLTHLVLEKNGIPTPELFAYYNPESSSADCDVVLNELKAKGISSCVIKPAVDVAHGEGVFVCSSIDYQTDDCILTKTSGERLSLRSFCEQNKHKSWLFEKRVVQSDQIGVINQSSVNTIRFMTALYPDGDVKVFAAFMKIGRAGSDVDNAGSGGNVDCAIDLETGVCYNSLQFNSFADIVRCDRHPDSNREINGLRIENWESVKRLICEYQSRIPELKAIGWDVALTDNGPVIIEINNWWDTTGQLFVGKGWREEVRNCFLAWEKYYID